ncbi:MAG TPA: YfcE family phosphodiesterase [Spirochaetia bacterium]|nr:YfcE family phosphodiesterase [Spirochaetales bacterium]HRS65516.1 YfcE family phosphodiesterase [Spirochaetia bacterium]HOT58919.1 YfcE family phosphodiesterase [Spirochaetales bacterium]HPD80577.1 YfcE family phosphodiesterase [Spirochaetales bacterium]HQG40226.1 YfcE family phosphodiesterase [Spirochaetales bacterium]
MYLIISDTHGQIEYFEKAINFCKNTVSAIIHCGDGVRDIAAITQKHTIPQCYSVRGNMDAHSNAPLVATLRVDNKKILILHGHTINFETILDDITVIAHKEKASAVIFGHTHIPLYKKRDGVLIINPGSLGKPRALWGPSFSLLRYDTDEGFSASFYEIVKNGKDFDFYEFTPV